MSNNRTVRRRSTGILALFAVLAAALAGAVMDFPGAGAAINEISAVEQLLELSGKEIYGSYVLTSDLDLTDTDFSGIKSLTGTLDGGGHTVTLDLDVSGNAALILKLDGTVKDLTVDGSVRGTGSAAGIAASAKGTIQNCTVRATVSTSSRSSLGGIANCDGKEVLDLVGCTFDGKTVFEQGFSSSNNYAYLGPFFGYNGGALGGGQMSEYSTFVYRITLPTAELSRIEKWEIFNTSKPEYTCEERTVGENTELIIRVPIRYATFSDDVSVMSHYGTPVVRWTLDDGSYRYLDGFDKANASYRSDLGATSLDRMYRYEDISELTVKGYTISDGVEDNEGDTVENAVGTLGGYLEISTAVQFESFVRLVNSAVPASFRNERGEKISYTSLNILTLGVRLLADIDLTQGDANGNHSEFYGLGKQEFFPYRGSLDGGNHRLTVDIDAPNGYMIGIISISSNLADPVRIENLTVAGTIKGKTKVGIVGYHDMVADNYADILGYSMGQIYFENVVNEADISGDYGVGGLLGVVSSTEGGLLAHFDSCENKGRISVSGGNGGGLLGAAGMYSKCTAEFRNCTNSGEIDGAGAKPVGGLAGLISQAGANFEQVKNTGAVTGLDAASTGAVAGQIADATGSVAAGHSDLVTAAGVQSERRFGRTSIVRKVTFTGESEYSYRGEPIAPEMEVELSACVRSEWSFTGMTAAGEAYESSSAPSEPGEYRLTLRTYLDPEDIAYGQLTERSDSWDYTIVRAVLAFDPQPQVIDYTEAQPMRAEEPAAEGIRYPFEWKTEYLIDGAYAEQIDAYGEYPVRFTLTVTNEMERYFSNLTEIETVYESCLTVRKPLLRISAGDLEMTYGQSLPRIEYTYDNGGVQKYGYDVAELGLSSTLGALNIDRAGTYRVQLNCAQESTHYRIQCQESFNLTVKKAAPEPLREEELTVTLENGTLTVTSDREGVVCRIAGESGFYGNVIRNLDAGRTYSIEVMLQENACYLASNLMTLTIEPEGSGGESSLLVPILIAAGVVLILAGALVAYEVSRRKRKNKLHDES